jgi:hypothetical protein
VLELVRIARAEIRRIDAIGDRRGPRGAGIFDLDGVAVGGHPAAPHGRPAPPMAARPRPLEAILHQIVGPHGIGGKNPRVAPERWDMFSETTGDIVHFSPDRAACMAGDDQS